MFHRCRQASRFRRPHQNPNHARKRGVAGARVGIIWAYVHNLSVTVKAIKPSLRLSASVFPQTLGAGLPTYGQDGTRLAADVDVFMPMIYTAENFPGQDPYKTVHDFTAAGVAKFGGARVRPWVQGFGAWAGNATVVCTQVKAAADAGASGAMVWWFDEFGTNAATWKLAAQCVPTTAPPPPGTPPPTASPFTGTIKIASQSAYGVYLSVTATAPVSKVTVSVAGHTPIVMTKRDGAGWSAKVSLPTGTSYVITASDAKADTFSASFIAK